MEFVDYFKEMWEFAAAGKTQGVWFYAALYTLALCLYSLLFQVRTRFWPFTEGVLAEVASEKFGARAPVTSDLDYIAKALYTYHVAGVDYEGTRISPWVFVCSHNARFILLKQMKNIQRLPDGKAKVFYDPRNPKKSYLMVAGKAGIFITLVISVMPFILYYAKYYA